jgi:putative phosphoesterase
MRILLVSDVHANRHALEAIREEFDLCLFLGDLVDYCVEPAPCIEWARQNVRYGVRGNHDHGAAQRVYVQGINGFRYLTGVTRPISIERLNEPDRRYLAALPTSRYLTLDGKRFFLVHATPRDPLDEFAPAEVDYWKRRLENIDADYVCVGHTHAQFVLQVGKTTVINPGSVGLPRDGDPRAAYAIITDEGPELKRVDYPIEQTIASIEATSMPDIAKAQLAEVLRTGKLEKKNGSSSESSINGEKLGFSDAASRS